MLHLVLFRNLAGFLVASTGSVWLVGCAQSQTTDGSRQNAAAGATTGTGGTVTTNGGATGNATGNSAGSGNASNAGTANAGTANAGAMNAGSGGDANGGATNGGAPSGGMSGTQSDAGQGGSFGSAGTDAGSIVDLNQVKPSVGCGVAATQGTGMLVMHTIQTSGVKADNCADTKCGAWSYPREYYLWLPPGYDENHAYPLAIEARGCSSNGSGVYSLLTSDTDATAAANNVIRVGLTPPPNDIGHATNPGQGCFDDKEGDDSVDFVFYEALIDQLKGELCYDENRVFAVGDSSGAWLANELGCKYAGNTEGYAIRGVAAHAGGLPTDPKYTPTCSGKPMAGIWAWRNPDNTDPFNPVAYAVDRALQINGCEATDFASAQSIPYPIGPNADASVCKQITGCPEQYPIVTCILPQGILSDDRFANPAFATFVQSFETP